MNIKEQTAEGRDGRRTCRENENVKAMWKRGGERGPQDRAEVFGAGGGIQVLDSEVEPSKRAQDGCLYDCMEWGSGGLKT